MIMFRGYGSGMSGCVPSNKGVEKVGLAAEAVAAPEGRPHLPSTLRHMRQAVAEKAAQR